MHYNVAQLLKEPAGSTRTYMVAESTPTDEGATYISPQGQLSLMRTDRGIWVSARLKVRVWVACSRCLERNQHPLRIAIEEEYLPTVDINTGQSSSVAEKAEGTLTIDRQHSLKLDEALRQYMITNGPMKPLCSPECRGLCPVCGTNRNETPCSCQAGPRNPQWTPLLKLLEGNGR